MTVTVIRRPRPELGPCNCCGSWHSPRHKFGTVIICRDEASCLAREAGRLGGAA